MAYSPTSPTNTSDDRLVLTIIPNPVFAEAISDLLLEKFVDYPFLVVGSISQALVERRAILVIAHVSTRNLAQTLVFLAKKFPGVRLLLVVDEMSEFIASRVLAARVDGLLLASAANRELWILAISTLLGGGRYHCKEYQEVVFKLRSDSRSWTKILTSNDLDLLEAFLDGKSDLLISEQFSLSSSSVRTYRHRLFRKLSLSSTIELMMWGVQKGFPRRALNAPYEAKTEREYLV